MVEEQRKKILNSLKPYILNLSHAYLFITDVEYDHGFVIDNFVSMIKKKYNKNEDNSDVSDLKIIKPDGMWIKKEQLLTLKKEFSTKSLTSSKRIYVICNADKLNQASANTLLKFLEDPEDDIVAILTTSNINNVYDTIVSRCNIINLNILTKNNLDLDFFSFFKEYISYDEYKKDDYGILFVDKVINFVSKYEEIKLKMIPFTKKEYHSFFTKREDVEISFQIMVMFYRDILRYMLKKDIIYFEKYIKEIENIAKNNNYTNIIEKINILNKKQEIIKYNVNISLLIDSLIFDFEGV